MATPYDNILSQYDSVFNDVGKYFTGGKAEADQYRAQIQQAVNLGIDPSVLTDNLTTLKKAQDYKNLRIAQGWNSAASDAVGHNFTQQSQAFSRALEGVQRVSDANAASKAISAAAPELTQAQVAGIVKGIAANDPLAKQALDEILARQSQLDNQNKQLDDFRSKLETQYFGAPGATLDQALSSTTGDIGQLNTFLGKQASDVFNKELKPQIMNSLGARGLSDSGAANELFSRELGNLERTRQASTLEAALGARSTIQGLTREDILGDVGARQQSLNEAFGLQRQAIAWNFQRELEQERAELARELASRSGGGDPSTLQQIIGGVGAATSVALAYPTGGASLSALPSFLSYGFGQQAGTAGTGASQLGMALAASNFSRDDRTYTPSKGSGHTSAKLRYY